jgi:hypothetical protein
MATNTAASARSFVRSLVVPNRSPIDKYVAAKRVLSDWRNVPSTRFEVEFCDVNIPTTEHYRRWDRGNSGSALLLDVGDLKYHHGYQSASQMAKMMSHVEGGATWNRLKELANINNRTGFLKQRRHSVAKIIREIYHVAPAGTDDLKWQRQCWANCMDVVDSFFWRMDQRNWDTLFSDATYKDLRRTWDGFNVEEPEVLEFTLPLYFRKLFRGGRALPEIERRMSWWLDNNKRVQNRHREARGKQYQFRRFHLRENVPAGVFRTDNYFESNAVGFQHLGAHLDDPKALALAVIRMPTGGMVILCSFRHEIDLKRVYEELAKREPNRWYLETRFMAGHMIMNQSWQFTGVTPSALTDDGLIKIIGANVRYLGRRKKEVEDGDHVE